MRGLSVQLQLSFFLNHLLNILTYKRERALVLRQLILSGIVTMASPKIALYLDVVSPFAYMAFHILRVSIPILTLLC